MAKANGTAMSNGSHDLPPSDSPSISLIHPTKEEQARQFGLNGLEWRGALSMDAYLRREAVLSSQEATRDGGITYWVLVDDANSANRRVLSGCETYRKRALVVGDGVVRDTTVHGVGSVFCPPQCRRRGFAGRMMKELGKQLRSWQDDDGCSCSILFSDIGKVYYASHGWEPYAAAHISVPASLETAVMGLADAHPLLASDLSELCSLDESLIRQSLKKEAALNGSKSIIAMLPDVQTMCWHHAREDFVGNEIHGKVPEIKGAIVGEEVGKRVWGYWTRMWYNEDPNHSHGNTLHILRLIDECKGIVDWETGSFTQAEKARIVPAIAAILALAQTEAAKWKMGEVEVWNPNSVTEEAARMLSPESKVVHRESDSIPSLKWFGKRDDKVKLQDDIVWIGNEKYCWC